MRVGFAEGGGWGAGAGSRGRWGGVSVEKFLLSEEQEDNKRAERGGSQRSSGGRIGSVRFMRRSDLVGRRHSVPAALAPGVPTSHRGDVSTVTSTINQSSATV